MGAGAQDRVGAYAARGGILEVESSCLIPEGAQVPHHAPHSTGDLSSAVETGDETGEIGENSKVRDTLGYGLTGGMRGWVVVVWWG